jgi:hypothetical protein
MFHDSNPMSDQTAIGYENLIKQGKLDELQGDLNYLHNHNPEMAYYAMRDLALLNRSDADNDPNLPKVTLYSASDSNTISSVSVATPGRVYGTNDKFIFGRDGGDNEDIAPEAVSVPDFSYRSKYSPENMEAILRSGDYDKFVEAVHTWTAHESAGAMDAFDKLQALNDADREKDSSLPIVTVQDGALEDGTIQAIFHDKANGYREFAENVG